MTQINVHKLDSVNMKIDCDDSIAKELNQFFTFEVPNYQYTPAYKNKKWDGMIRLFNLYSRRLYIGLMDYLIQFAKDRNYTIDQDFDNFSLDWCKSCWAIVFLVVVLLYLLLNGFMGIKNLI